MHTTTSHLTLKALPIEDRPTEKLKRLGTAALSDAELLAVIIRSGTQKETALALSQRLVLSPQNLLESSLEELQMTSGIGQVRAAQIKAAIELGSRLQKLNSPRAEQKIRDPKDAIDLIEGEMKQLTREEFRIILLDSRHRVIKISAISMGTLNATIVHPRDLFREAIKANAAAIILAHNHPSGESEPSKEDIATTQRFIKIGEMTGIPVVDHLIIASGGSISLKQRGEI